MEATWIMVAIGFLQLVQAVVLAVAGWAWHQIWGEVHDLRKQQNAMARDLNQLLGAQGLKGTQRD